MRRSSAAPIALLIVVALATAWAFSNMVGKRFASGEVYPYYSTLRTDPLGARALYQSLDRLPLTTCARNFGRIGKLEGTRGQTLILLNVDPMAFDSAVRIDGEAIKKFASTGGRVVVTLDARLSNWDKIQEASDKRRNENRSLRDEARRKARGEKPASDDSKKEEQDDSKKKGSPAKKPEGKDAKDPDMEEYLAHLRSVRGVLGVTVKQKTYKVEAGEVEGLFLKGTPALPLEQGALPTWRSQTTLVFEEDDEDEVEESPAADAAKAKERGKSKGKTEAVEPPVAPAKSGDSTDAIKPKRSTRDKWTVLGEVEGGAVLAERRFGSGSIILATDSYFASNEALSKAPAVGFLAWLVGEAREVFFDETHLGTKEDPGIVALARKHNLHGLFVGGLILFALFVWRSSMSLVPSNGDDEDPTRVISGHGATAGLVSLLKRGISRGQVLSRCFESWEKTVPRRHATVQARIDLARTLLPPPHVTRARSGVLTTLYRQICEILHPKRK